MNPGKWSHLRGSVASATLLLAFSNACVVSGTLAQSTTPATAGSSLSGIPSVPFMVAPSFPVAGSPVGMAMGDLNQDGKLDLVTTDSVSGMVTVFLGTGGGKFASGVQYSTGSHPGSIVVADLNGDGQLEVILGDESQDTISVLACNGTGTLQLKQSITAGTDPAFMAIADINGDGKPDIVVAPRSGGSLAVLLNDSKGDLESPVLASTVKGPTAIAIGDLNNDGHADIALANADGTISILLGSGNGKFHAIPEVSVAAGGLSSIAVGDFNRDGKLDLAVTQPGSKTMSVLWGKGDGSFGPSESYSVGINPMSVLTGDFDGDGIPDLIAINQGSNTFSVLGGNGDGTFKNPVDFVVGNAPLAAALGDFDGGGHLDLAVLNASSQSVSVAFGNGDGTFKASRSYPAGIEPRAVASADLNGDKLPDLVVTNYCGTDASCAKGGSVAVFLAGKDGAYQPSDTYQIGSGPVSVVLVDTNGDKVPDIVALNRADKTVSVLLGKGDGTFELPLTTSIIDSPIAVAVGDFNKDGKPDLAVLGDCGSAKCTEPGNVEILWGQGAGAFIGDSVYPVGFSPTSIVAGDLNRDKNLDLVVSNSCGTDASCRSAGTASILLGNAAGKFSAGANVPVGNQPSSTALGDMSGRGVLDLLVSSASGNTVSVHPGKGDATFLTPTVYAVGNSPSSVVVADFNGDGKPDVAVANVQDSTVSVLFGKGDGTLNAAFSLPVGAGPESLTAVVGSGSNHASLATANGNSGSAATGRDLTVLSNVEPDAGLPTTGVTLAITSPSPAVATSVNQSVTLQATVSPEGSPAGTVSFLSANNGGAATLIPDCSASTAVNSSGVAVCTTSSLPAGTDSITATYSGDTSYGVSSSNALSQTVNQITGMVSLGSSAPTSSAVNDAVTFTATVGAGTSPETPIAPTGTVGFTLNGTAITSCTNVPLVGGSATCTLNNLLATTATTPSNIGATYSGDQNFTTANATPLVQTVNPLPVTLNLATSLSPSNVNQSVTFTASLSAGASSESPIAPTGTVTFTANTVPIAFCTSVAKGTGGTWVCTTSSLVGTTTADTISAIYGGDNNYSVTTVNTASQTINALPATLAVTSSPTAPTVDQSVTFTATLNAATLTPVIPSGTVNFSINKSPNSDCPSQKIKLVGSAWTATCTTSSLLAPADVIGAVYNGDSSYTVSAQPTFTQTVNQALPVVSVASSLPTSSVNQTVLFTASVGVSGIPTLKVAPTGTVTFTQGTTTLCSGVALSGNPASASCSYAFPTVIASPGALVSATYSGDSNFLAGVSGAPQSATQIVIPTNTKTSLSSALATSTVNQSVVFTAAITPSITGTAAPQSGTVAFADTSTNPATTLCSNPITPTSAVSICTFAFTSAGPHVITAAFTSTDPNFNSSASSNYTQTVGASATSISVASGTAPSTVNQAVTFSATVTATTAGTAVPQGSVTYTDSLTSTTLCPAQSLVSGVAPSCTAVLPTAATHTIVATFTPSNTNFQAATSSVLNQVVNPGTTTTVLAASPSTSTVDQPVAFTATITPSTSGVTNPTGKVSFSYVQAGTTILLCSTQQTVKTVGSVTSAACTAPFPAASTYTVTAAYTSGDPNFTGSTAPPLSQIVNASGTSVTVSTPSPSPSSVNQPVSFSAVVTPTSVTDTGLTLPTGSVTFSDAIAGTLCTSTLAADGSVLPCKATLGTAGLHGITAVYSGDSNFSTSASANALSQTVNQGATSISIVSSSLTTVVTQAVTYTATVTPALPGTAPTGAITFSLNQGGSTYACVAAASLPAGGTAPYSESCTISYPNTVTGNITVTASYAGDANFTGSTSAPITQTVQNFSSSITPGEITLAQGSPTTPNTNLIDPFSATPILLTSTALNGFSDPVAVISCSVAPDSSGNAIPGLSCSPVAAPTTASGIAVITATSAVPVGTYTVQLTVGDAKVPTLAHLVNLSVNVINLASQASTPIIGTTTATFSLSTPLPSGATLSYGSISIVNSDGTYTTIPMTEVGIQVSSITPVSGSNTSYNFTVTAGTTASAQLATSHTVITAAAVGVPILFLMGLLPRARNRRKSWLRYLSMVLFAIAAMQSIGCSSGGFTRASASVGAVGSYVIQIESTQNENTTTVAVVPLLIEQ